MYRDALDFQWDLSPNALYHDGIIVLSYPMSLLSEGPRRPIVPYWLYRPELLGIYLSGGVFLVTLVLLIRTGLTSRRPKL